MTEQQEQQLAKEKEAVKQLGEVIGYGNMMNLAAELWQEHMRENNYPVTGIHIPALLLDIDPKKKEHYKKWLQ